MYICEAYLLSAVGDARLIKPCSARGKYRQTPDQPGSTSDQDSTGKLREAQANPASTPNHHSMFICEAYHLRAAGDARLSTSAPAGRTGKTRITPSGDTLGLQSRVG